MAFIYRTIPRVKVLHAYIEGEFSLEPAKQHFLEIIAALERHRSESVLVDGLGMVGDPTVIERFYYGEFVAEVVGQFRARSLPRRNPPFAYVMREPVLDPMRLGESVAVNRGMNVRAFNSIDAAIEWLKLTPEDILDA